MLKTFAETSILDVWLDCEYSSAKEVFRNFTDFISKKVKKAPKKSLNENVIPWAPF